MSVGARTIRVGGGTLPIEGSADLLVIGGTYGGCAAALGAARAGRSVVLVEPRTYLGYETSALLRPWLPPAALERPPAVIQPWLSEAAPLPAGGEVPLHPDTVKLGLEDTLLEAGVRLLYASHPIGVVFEGDRLAGAVVGNKSSRQVILSRAVVDCTDWGVYARLAGAPFRAPPSPSTAPATATVRRTLEFTGVDGAALGAAAPDGALPVPERFGLLDDAARMHSGYLGPAHVLVECPLQLTLEPADPRGRMALEIEARRRTMALAAHLVAEEPAFRGAYLAHTSWELWRPSPWRLEGGGPAVPELPGLFVLGSAAPGNAAAPEDFLEPMTAAQAGEALVPAVLDAIAGAPPPAAARCAARCGPPAPAAPPSADGRVVVREQAAVQRGREYARVVEQETLVPVLADVDVLVAGGGTSGATAAAVSSEQGARTALLELNSGLGGTGTVGGVDSYWYGRRVGFTATVDRHYAEDAARLGLNPSIAGRDAPASHKWNVEAKMHGLLRWTTDSRVDLAFRCTVVGALVEPQPEGGARPTVRGVLAATPDGLHAVLAAVTIDASGDADVAAFAGARTVYGSARDRLPLWYSMAPLVRPGLTRNNFTSSVDVSNVNDYTRAILAGRRRGEGHDHTTYVAPRETRHIVGGVTLTLTDQLTLRRFPDTVAVCFSNSDIKGKSAARWVLWGLLPPNVESEVPYRAVLPDDLDGILVCGKAMSCTHDALPAIRMQADLQNLGGACAVAAATAARARIEPREVDVRALQAELVRRGALPAERVGRAESPEEPADAELRVLVDGLTGDEPFYIDMGHEDVQLEPMALVRVCTAGPRIVRFLETAFASAHGQRRLLLARLLAWYGSPTGLLELAGAIERALAGGVLPVRESKVRHANFPPDQGAMPEVCYLIFSLGMVDAPPGSAARERILQVLARVVDLLRPTPDDFRDRVKGTFYYVDAVCHVAERLADARAAPLLTALHGRDGLHDLRASAPQADFFLERMAYLEVAIGRALARCGGPRGVEILAGYLDDSRAILAEHAHDELVAVSGEDLGKDTAAWLAWLHRHAGELRSSPWTQRID